MKKIQLEKKAILQERKNYKKPELIVYGSVNDLTQARRRGPNRDGGANPFHKCGRRECPS